MILLDKHLKKKKKKEKKSQETKHNQVLRIVCLFVCLFVRFFFCHILIFTCESVPSTTFFRPFFLFFPSYILFCQ